MSLLFLVPVALALPAELGAVLPRNAWEQAPVFELAPPRRKSIASPEKGGPVRFAVSQPLAVDLVEAARWISLPGGGRLGQVRVRAPTATSLSLELADAWLPPGGRLWLDAADGSDARRRPVVRASGGPLWTPLVRSDELVLTVELPAHAPTPRLQLRAVKTGVLPMGTPPPQGSCNIDVVCPESEGWESEIATVAVYAIEGEFWCTGFLLNTPRRDGEPLFATADHCGVGSRAARSMVVYWNYESPSCGRLSGGSIDDWQAGAETLMADSPSDWSLLRLDDVPDADFGVAFAGWDNSGAAPQRATAIHHPRTDEKAISFEDDPTRITWDYEDREDLSATHIRVGDWDLGTTEGGSSGSPLFDENHRVAGILTGGYADCGNDEPDWYGRLYSAWDGSRSDRRLRDWLDPDDSGAVTVDTWAQWMTGVVVAGDMLEARGPEGGPFAPTQATAELTNHDGVDHAVTLRSDVDWASAADPGLVLEAGATASVVVQLGEAAALLPPGRHEGSIHLEWAGAAGPLSVPVSVVVGTAERQLWWPLDEDPGWDAEGLWDFGVPLGRGGINGSPDPTSGATGDHVYGFNLGGDYGNWERARHLTTPALDLSALAGTELRFFRWLGVEEPAYDNADVQVSIDGGESWTVVWSNTAEVDDGAWVLQSIDLSGLADGQADVRVRWTMGATDESETWCGWNIDDIEILGIVSQEVDPFVPEGEPEAGDSGVAEGDPSDAPTADSAGETKEARACGCGTGSLPAMLGGLPLLLLAVRRRTGPIGDPR